MASGSHSRWLAVLGVVAAALILFACPSPAHASGGVVGVPLSTCVAPAIGTATARQMFSRQEHFDCNRAPTDFGPGDFWVLSQRLGGVEDLADRDHVRIASLWQDGITLYALYPDGAISSFPLDGRATTQHLQLGAIIEWSLPHRSAPPIQLLWHVKNASNLRGIVNAPRLASSRESNRSNLVMGAIYAAFGGLCFALLVYNLAMWAALRHRFQLAYCAMVLALLVYAFTSSGALAWVDPNGVNNDRLRLSYLLLAMAVTTALYFARCFFDDSASSGWVGKFTLGSIAGILSAALAFVALAPWHIQLLDALYALAFLTTLGAVVAILVRARRTANPYLWLFGIAWGIPITFACVRLLANLSFISWNFWIDNSTILSMSFEAVMSTLAIAYRIRLLSKERDEARTQELAARMLADIDPLTGLLNRRSFLAKAIQREEEQQLLLADLDHFKRVNETLGHDGGDEVLRVFARTLRLALPPEALIARIGGEEFAITVPSRLGVDADMLLASVRRARMPFDLSVTASIGTCCGPLANDVDWKHLYHRADRALFAAKSAGRDRVRRAESLASAA